MKVSVVILTYNEEQYIADCLESFKKQDEQPDEIIVVDNNCTDQTVNIARRYGATVVAEQKKGIIFARNRGFNTAQHDIIARVDADTRPPAFWIKKIKDDFTKHQGIDALVGPIVFYDLAFRTTFFSAAFNEILNRVMHHYPLIGPNMAIKRKIWQRVKDTACLDDKLVHEDIDLGIHIHKAGGVIYYDRSLISYISGRRIRYNPLSFFAEYPRRLITTLQANHR